MNSIITKGIRIFGSKEAFDSWINTPNVSLGDVKPKDLMDSSEGIKVIENALDCLSWGSYL